MTIYLEKGFKNNRIQVLENSVNSFEWLQTYEPREIKRKNNENDDSYKTRLKQEKSKQEYFISGYIEPNERGTIKRNNEQLIRRDLIIIDYDEIASNSEIFINHVTEKLSNTAFILYPTISYTDSNPRFRVILDPSRPLLKYEYLAMLKEITDKIGLPYDKSSETWSQCQGLPVITEFNKVQRLSIVPGEKYPIPRNIQPPIQKKVLPVSINGGIENDLSSIPHDKAIEIFKAYIEEDGNNLYEYSTANHAILVLAKAVQNEEIDYNTALECSELLAMGNIEWIEGNRQQLNYAVQKTEIRTSYTFKRKFHDLFQKQKQPTLNDLKYRLRELGEEWRDKHAKEDKVCTCKPSSNSRYFKKSM